ncbi:uncharacterized protein LOC117562816 [Gymnodraco acuticeps]|uniref:Uncharacterized protein LOC117562816 n=1 Tax=Gymnodraco acuticeps TaxID=8218 RepID=A0A6P8VZE7_GYMAC|nr:uncharacterized protein LOC117562816 [Gymnodraco acuticeps]
MAVCGKREVSPVVCIKARLECSPESNPAGLPFPQTNGKTGSDYVKWASDLVTKEYKHETFELKKPAGARWKIGPLEDTIYSEKHKVVNGWGTFYLPEKVRMQVVGVVEGISCPWDQLVLMTCEDGKLYAYDGEELHLVASSMEQLDEEGIEYPASKTYYEGEAFKDMTVKDWEKDWKSPTVRALKEEHHTQVMEHKAKSMEYLKATAAIQESRGKPPGQSVTSRAAPSYTQITQTVRGLTSRRGPHLAEGVSPRGGSYTSRRGPHLKRNCGAIKCAAVSPLPGSTSNHPPSPRRRSRHIEPPHMTLRGATSCPGAALVI